MLSQTLVQSAPWTPMAVQIGAAITIAALAGAVIVTRHPPLPRWLKVLAPICVLAVSVGGGHVATHILIDIPPIPDCCDPWLLEVFFLCWCW